MYIWGAASLRGAGLYGILFIRMKKGAEVPVKKRTIGLMLALILAISVCLPAMAEGETQTNWLSVAPGDCWTVTNTGETDISIDDISRMDYVITDAEGYVTARDVNDPGWHDPLILPAGGQFIVANTGLASLSMIKLEGDIEAEKNEPPALLHADLRFGEACAFKNTTDHSANVLLRTESNRAWRPQKVSRTLCEIS